MRILAIALALTMPFPALAHAPDMFVAILPEKASGFKDLVECQEALGVSAQERGKASADRLDTPRGSLFNRTRGNISRCEMVEGEVVVVVYPKGHEAIAQPTDRARQ